MRKLPSSQRIVDVALPADGRARLFEIHAHDDQQIVAQAIRGRPEPMGVVERLVVIVDRARAHHGKQAIVPSVQDVRHRGPARFDVRLHGGRHGQLVEQECRGNERTDRTDAHVIDAGGVLGSVGHADFLVALGIVDANHGKLLKHERCAETGAVRRLPIDGGNRRSERRMAAQAGIVVSRARVSDAQTEGGLEPAQKPRLSSRSSTCSWPATTSGDRD